MRLPPIKEALTASLLLTYDSNASSFSFPGEGRGSPTPLTKMLVFFVGRAVAGLTGLAALGGVPLTGARGPGAVHMVLTGRDGVRSATWGPRRKVVSAGSPSEARQKNQGESS